MFVMKYSRFFTFLWCFADMSLFPLTLDMELEGHLATKLLQKYVGHSEPRSHQTVTTLKGALTIYYTLLICCFQIILVALW